VISRTQIILSFGTRIMSASLRNHRQQFLILPLVARSLTPQETNFEIFRRAAIASLGDRGCHLNEGNVGNMEDCRFHAGLSRYIALGGNGIIAATPHAHVVAAFEVASEDFRSGKDRLSKSGE